jgi:hypothetical protein
LIIYRNGILKPKIADRRRDGIPDFTPILGLIREERILSILGIPDVLTNVMRIGIE